MRASKERTGAAVEECYVELGAWITKRRKELGLQQRDVAMMMRLSRPSIANIEAGKQRVLHHVFLEFKQRLTTEGVEEYRASLVATLSKEEEDRILAVAEAIRQRRRKTTPARCAGFDGRN